MPILKSKQERLFEKAELVQSVPARRTGAEVLQREGGATFNSTFGIGDLPPGWNPDQTIHETSGLRRLGLYGESWYAAWYNSLIAPWMSTPAGLAVVNTLANAVAALPLEQKHITTGETRPLPDIFEFPHSRLYNPSFTLRELLKQVVTNQYRYGMCHILLRFKDKKLVMMRPLDSLTLRTDGPPTRPRWRIVGRGSNFATSRNAGTDPDLPESGTVIYPDGRRLKEQDSPSAEWGMIALYLNRAPDSNVGAPPGLLTYDATLAATEAQRHASSFFRDGAWQHLFVSPSPALEDVSGVKSANKAIKESLAGSHRATIAPMPYEVRPVGFSAEDSQLVESREADMAFQAIAHGMPASLFSAKGGSFAQVYADTIRETTGGTLPLACDIEDKCSWVLPEYDKGWRLWFDRTSIKNGDPHTAAQIATLLAKAGLIDTDEGRATTGRDAYGKDWSQIPMMDGNRRPANKLAELADSQIKKNSGQESDGGKTKPEYPAVPSN